MIENQFTLWFSGGEPKRLFGSLGSVNQRVNQESSELLENGLVHPNQDPNQRANQSTNAGAKNRRILRKRRAQN
jgi:hypothetical protein